MSNLLTEFNINEINGSQETFYKFNYSKSSKKVKNYLKLKRKRSSHKLKNDDTILKETIKKIKTNCNSIEIEKSIDNKIAKKEIQNTNNTNNVIKFQNFSKYILSIIAAFLRVDDLIKLKNIGSHNIRICINEILELMQNNNNYFSLHENNSSNNVFLNDYDSLYCKKYFLKNAYIKDINTFINISKKDIKVKYVLYHEPTNSIYYIIHHLFYDYFCCTELKTEEGEKQNKNWKNNILFTLPFKDYYEKFQFLDEYKDSEVAIFSMNKILLYDISTHKKEQCIFLSSPCDYVLYKKELKILIIPNGNNEIEIFKIYYWKKNIRQPFTKFKISENNFHNSEKCKKPTILNISDYYTDNNNNTIKNLICIYFPGDKKIIIYDCKLMKMIKEILSKSNIIKLIINNQYLISITQDKYMNYFSIINDYSFLNCFNLNNICKWDKIKYISPLNSKYLENMYLILVRITDNNRNYSFKPFLLYLENISNKNNFYFCFIPLKNNINDYIYDDEMIYPSLINVKNNNEKLIKMKLVICHLNEDYRNMSSDNLKKKNTNKNKINYFIKEYCSNI